MCRDGYTGGWDSELSPSQTFPLVSVPYRRKKWRWAGWGGVGWCLVYLLPLKLHDVTYKALSETTCMIKLVTLEVGNRHRIGELWHSSEGALSLQTTFGSVSTHQLFSSLRTLWAVIMVARFSPALKVSTKQ